jgi:hypothetical protein
VRDEVQLPWLSGRDLERVMGRAVCDGLGRHKVSLIEHRMEGFQEKRFVARFDGTFFC